MKRATMTITFEAFEPFEAFSGKYFMLNFTILLREKVYKWLKCLKCLKTFEVLHG